VASGTGDVMWAITGFLMGVVFTIGIIALMNGILENDRKQRKKEGE
jgi:hypothetical protein